MKFCIETQPKQISFILNILCRIREKKETTLQKSEVVYDKFRLVGFYNSWLCEQNLAMILSDINSSWQEV